MAPKLRPIAPREPLRKQVYTKLREGLRSGMISGSRLLVERELAEQLGVSRTPVREALALLESDGILVATGRGFTPKVLNDAEIRDIYEIRQLLEPHAIASITANLDDSTLALLQAQYDAQAQAHKDNEDGSFAEANRNFRAIWIAEVTNPRLAAEIERYDDHIVFLRKITLSEPKHRKSALKSLLVLLKTLHEGDQYAVKEAMSRHLARAENSLRTSLKESSTAD